MNPYTQSEAADRKFIAKLLTRCGTVQAAIEEVRKLRSMGQDGQTWWSYIEARLAYLIPIERQKHGSDK